ncbi:DUF4113 domain-containing protein, partial [Enterobacter hormaechei]|uniref:DUF4113 domain-containing protein n=1 Tax=Enterobacter hormaechei TaxID=158836 RepID=UPI0019213EFB|nr:DUF4113 domain-containing protein [Enterobacter hormaechei]
RSKTRELEWVWVGGRRIATEWQMKREMVSLAYTTRCSDIPKASILVSEEVFHFDPGLLLSTLLIIFSNFRLDCRIKISCAQFCKHITDIGLGWLPSRCLT